MNKVNNDSIIGKKSYSFALEIIKLYKTLAAEKKEYVLSKQILRCGTSIGANINEALSAESKRDFIHKMGLAQKETKETYYWLNLLYDSGYIENNIFKQLIEFCKELNRMLASIILTTKERYLSKKQTHNS